MTSRDSLVARLGGLARSGHAADSPAVVETRRALAEANLSAAIERTVAGAPRLTDEQIERLSALLRAS